MEAGTLNPNEQAALDFGREKLLPQARQWLANDSRTPARRALATLVGADLGPLVVFGVNGNRSRALFCGVLNLSHSGQGDILDLSDRREETWAKEMLALVSEDRTDTAYRLLANWWPEQAESGRRKPGALITLTSDGLTKLSRANVRARGSKLSLGAWLADAFGQMRRTKDLRIAPEDHPLARWFSMAVVLGPSAPLWRAIGLVARHGPI